MLIQNNLLRVFLVLLTFSIFWKSYSKSSNTKLIDPHSVIIEGRCLNPIFDELITQKDVVYGASKNTLGLDEYLKMGYVIAPISCRENLAVATAVLLKSNERTLMTIETALNTTFDGKASVRFFSKDIEKENLYKINRKNIFFDGYSAAVFMDFVTVSCNSLDIPSELYTKNCYICVQSFKLDYLFT